MRLLALALFVVAATAACNKAGTRALNTCKTDADCKAPGTRCDTASLTCVCKTDEACPDSTYFCNGAGVCQKRAGCTSNLDCAGLANTFCDVTSGQCLSGPAIQLGSACGLADHCPYGTICTGGKCVAGCFDDGDCPLYQICSGGKCITGAGICSNDGFCGYKQRCDTGQCKTDRRGPYCRGCTMRTNVNPEPCDAPRNFCLVNNQEHGGFAEFCGVDCSLGQSCPNGYFCDGVVILTEDVCTLDAECRCDRNHISFPARTCRISSPCEPKLPNGQPDPNASVCTFKDHPDCNPGTTTSTRTSACFVATGAQVGNCECLSNADCANGGTCVAGVCCTGKIRAGRSCSVGESDVSGFCTCETDDDCPHDSCETTRGACAFTGKPCTPGGNECGPIPCVMGGCLIGQNCAPVGGLSCSIVGGSGM